MSVHFFYRSNRGDKAYNKSKTDKVYEKNIYLKTKNGTKKSQKKYVKSDLIVKQI